jgi:hypothetical protein
MRTLTLILLAAWLHSHAFAADCGNDATPEQIAKAVEDAVRQKEPLSGGKPIVPDATVAKAIHFAVASAVYGKEGVERERPFRAVRSGEYWVVYGCMPPEMLGGVAVTIIRARDGAVISLSSGQ